jgi:hypothetical protein
MRNEYLVTENRILRKQVKGHVHLSDGERKTLAEISKKLRTVSRYRSTSRAQRLSDRPAAIVASAALDPRDVSGAAARLALRDGNEVSPCDRRWALPAVITRNKHSEALRGLLCLLTGGGLISVKLTFPLAQLLPCMPYSPYEDTTTNQPVWASSASGRDHQSMCPAVPSLLPQLPGRRRVDGRTRHYPDLGLLKDYHCEATWVF